MSDEFDNTDNLTVDDFENDTEYVAKEKEADEAQCRLDELRETCKQLAAQDGICQADVVSVESHFPKIFTDKMPLASFTKDPSMTNRDFAIKQLKIQMESVSVAMIVYVAYLIGLCIAWIYFFFKYRKIKKEILKRREEYDHMTKTMREYWKHDAAFNEKLKKHFGSMSPGDEHGMQKFQEMLKEYGVHMHGAEDGFSVIDLAHRKRVRDYLETNYNVLIHDVLTNGHITKSVGECVVGVNMTINSVVKSTESLIREVHANDGTSTIEQTVENIRSGHRGFTSQYDSVINETRRVLIEVFKKVGIEVKLEDANALMTAMGKFKEGIVKASETKLQPDDLSTSSEALGKAFAARQEIGMWVDEGLAPKFKQLESNVSTIERQNKAVPYGDERIQRWIHSLRDVVRVYTNILMLGRTLLTRLTHFINSYINFEKQHAHEELSLFKLYAKISEDAAAKGRVVDLNKHYNDTWSSELLGLPAPGKAA